MGGMMPQPGMMGPYGQAPYPGQAGQGQSPYGYAPNAYQSPYGASNSYA